MSPSAIEASPPPTPSSQRCEPGSLNIPIAPWPASAADGPVDAAAVAADIIAKLNAGLANKQPGEVAALFLDDDNCYWRDHLALSWDLRTLKGRAKIASFLGSGNGVSELKMSVEVDSSSARSRVVV